MDDAVIAALQQAGIETGFHGVMPSIRVGLDANGALAPVQFRVVVELEDRSTEVELKGIQQLFAGNGVPPELREGPTPEYEPFFKLLETTAMRCCEAVGPEYDREFERLWAQLRRRPASNDKNPLFTYLRAAACLYMSIRDTSQAEFEKVVQRLSRSAGHFTTGLTSTNYIDTISDHLF